MTVHPFRPAVPDDDPFEAAPPSDESDPTVGDLERSIDLFPAEPEGVDELIDALDDSSDRFDSFDRSHVLAHRAVSPGLLAGLCWLELPVCAVFHTAWFELLEDIGNLDGVIATAGFYAGSTTDRTRLRTADAWVWDHPVPTDDEVDRASRDLVADHSLELAIDLGSNPSLTFASPAALRAELLDRMFQHAPSGLEISDEQIDDLVDVTVRLLSELWYTVSVVGGVRIVAAAMSTSRN